MTTELPDICDFCNLALSEDDDDLVPFWVGESENPKPITVTAIDESNRYTVEQGAQMLVDRLRRHPSFDIALHGHGVMDVEPEWIEMTSASNPQPKFTGAVEPPKIDTTKRVVKLTVRPETERRDPDAMLCQDCADQFKSMGDSNEN